MTNLEQQQALWADYAKYLLLLNKQIVPIKEKLLEMMPILQDGISNLIDITEEKVNEANTVIKKESGTDFVKKKLKAVKSSQKNTDTNPKELRERIKQLNMAHAGAGMKFKEEMKKINELQDKLQDWLFSMVGFLSAEDVITQRLEHVEKGLDQVRTKVPEFYFAESGLEAFFGIRQGILTEIFKTFTTEEEKSLFNKKFDHKLSKSA